MKHNNKSIIFTSLALNQTKYFTGLAKNLESMGYAVCIVCFHEPSVKYVENNNIKAYNVYSIVDSLNQFPEPKDVEIEELNLLISRIDSDCNEHMLLLNKLLLFSHLVLSIIQNLQ